MAAKSQDKIFFGVALLVLLSSAAWTYLQQPKLAALRKSPAAGGAQAAYVPAGIDAPTVSTSTWPPPPAQTHGPEWVYDVFTPPEIYYNEETKEFSVTPPTATTKVVIKPKEQPFGLELVKVKQDVFRLQLVGYVGNAGDYVGTFENEVTGETFLARAGKKVPALGLTIRDFNVKRTLVPAPDSMPIYETIATAVVVDDKTEEAVTLTNKERLVKGTPIAILKAPDSDTLYEQKTDTSIMLGTVKYTVRSISVEPPSAEITKETQGGAKAPVTKTLTLQTASVPEAPAQPDQVPPAQPVPPDTTGIFGN